MEIEAVAALAVTLDGVRRTRWEDAPSGVTTADWSHVSWTTSISWSVATPTAVTRYCRRFPVRSASRRGT